MQILVVILYLFYRVYHDQSNLKFQQGVGQ